MKEVEFILSLIMLLLKSNFDSTLQIYSKISGIAKNLISPSDDKLNLQEVYLYSTSDNQNAIKIDFQIRTF